MRQLIAVLALVVAGVPGRAAQAPPSATDLAARLQAHYATVKSFTAEFTQTFQNALTPQKTPQEQGDVKVLKPDMMWWTYKKPEKRQFVADGRSIYSYETADNTVERWAMPRGQDAPTALLFLAGRGDFVRDFTPSIVSGAPANELRLKLVPKNQQADFSFITIAVDAKTFALLEFASVDDHGTNTIRFTNLKENVSLSGADFKFSTKGMTVIDR